MAAGSFLLLGTPGSGGGGNPPATPNLSVTDNGNGTGGVATVSGSTGGATNNVEVASLSATGGLTWQSFSRVSDGTLALSLADGLYLAICYSSLAGLPGVPSQPFEFSITGGAGQALFRAAAYQYLSTNAGIVGRVGSRVFPLKLPQSVARPALLYSVSIDHEHYATGSAGHAAAKLKLACVADKYSDADQLAEAVRQACDGASRQTVAGVFFASMTIAAESDAFEEPIDGGDTGLFVIQLEYDVRFSETQP